MTHSKPDQKIAEAPIHQCSQCGKPAMYNVSGHLLCLDCYGKWAYLEDLNLSRLIDELNYNSALMNTTIGFGISPKMANFRAQPPRGTLFLTNISIEGSNIGTINTGTIQGLDNAITFINQQAQPELGNGLKEVAQAVIRTNDLVQEVKQEVLESLSFIADQVSKPKQDRKAVLTKTLLERLPTLLQSATALMDLWQRIEPLIRQALNK